jgi:hypothetical protein
MSTIVGVVVHIQQGTEAGTEAWQNNPASQVSSHFLSPKVGRGRQMVDTQDKAWAEATGNSHWLSVENEGLTGQALTPDQVEFNAQVLAKAHVVYNVPLQVSNGPDVPGLCHHSAGGIPWGNHPDCPGPPVIAQKPAIVARAQQIVDEMTANYDQARLTAIGATYQGYPADPLYKDLAANSIQAVLVAIRDLTAKVDKLSASSGVQAGTKLAVTVDSVS